MAEENIVAANVVAANVVALTEMEMALSWIGFNNPAQRNSLVAEGFSELTDLLDVNEKDIRDMADGFMRRTAAAGRMTIGLRRTKLLIGMVHWAQDKRRVSSPIALGTLTEADFREELQEALKRAEVRKAEADQVDTLSKAADPGKLKDENKWMQWKVAFNNYLSTIPGVTGIPLSYVIRDNEAPDLGGDFQDFNERMIACAPITGVTFVSDARKVHQLIKSFLTPEQEAWISDVDRRQNGRIDWGILVTHFEGEGNTSRRITVAERMKESLFYKNERAMPYQTFLDKAKHMFNIFRQEEEPMTESQKVRWLLSRIQHAGLTSTVGALRVRSDLDGITFDEAANFIASAVSEQPDYQARKISQVGTDGGSGGGGAPVSGIHKKDGSIHTGYYPNWKQLDAEQKKKVIAARNKKKGKGHTKKTDKRSTAALTQVAKDMESLKRDVARMVSAVSAAGGAPEDHNDGDEPSEDAGNAFGGRRSKKKQKKEE